MEITQKVKIYDYSQYIVLSLILVFFIYNVISILFISSHKEKTRWSNIMSTVKVVESNLRNSKPPELEEVSKSYLVNNISDSPMVEPIKRASIFVGPEEEQVLEGEFVEGVQYEKVDIPFATEIVFKGVADDIALINVRRKINEQWHEHSFSVKRGDRVGEEKIIGKRKVNFITNCILQDIINKAQRPVTVMKRIVILDEEGGFVGIRMVPGETYMKSTSKIIYKDEEGNAKEVWLGKTEVIKEEEPEEEPEWYEDPVGTVKSKYKDVTGAVKSAITDGDETVEDTK